MSLHTIPDAFGSGGSGLCDGTLKSILTELQGLSFALVNGAAADTDITLTGIATEDTIAFILGLDPDNETAAEQVLDFTADFAITAADTIKAATQATTGYDLVVVWYNKS